MPAHTHVKKGIKGLEAPIMTACVCSETKHGHGNPCGKPTAPASQKCKGCEEEAEREFAGTRHEGTPQDIPPGRK